MTKPPPTLKIAPSFRAEFAPAPPSRIDDNKPTADECRGRITTTALNEAVAAVAYVVELMELWDAVDPRDVPLIHAKNALHEIREALRTHRERGIAEPPTA